MSNTTATGAFSPRHVATKRWKTDPGLERAIRDAIPVGATCNDIGAGVGRYVEWMREHGYPDTVGYDGIADIEEISNGLVKHADLTSSGLIGAGVVRTAEWSLFVEVGEHIPADYECRYIPTVANSAQDGLLVSWAVPGQRGRDHINCRTPEYVTGEFVRQGWRLDEPATLRARQVAGKGWAHKLLIFAP